MVLTGFTSSVSSLRDLNVLTNGNHRKPDGRFQANTAGIRCLWSAKARDLTLPDPTYFDQEPYEEHGRHVIGDFVTNPVLHMKLEGSISLSLPNHGFTVSSWDCIHQTSPGYSEQVVVGPASATSLSFTGTADNAASGVANEWRTEVYFRTQTYPVSGGRSFTVLRVAEIRYDTNIGGSRKTGGISGKLSSTGILWKGENFSLVTYYRTSVGTNRSVSVTSVVPSGEPKGRNNLTASQVEFYLGQYRQYASAYLGELLPVSDASGTPGVHPYFDIEDASQRARNWAQSLNPLNFLYGEIWRGYYSLNELSHDAVNSLPGFDSNGIALAKDLPSFAKEAFDFSEGLSRLGLRLLAGGKGQYVQASSSLAAQSFLSEHYGLRLTLLDLRDLIRQTLKTSAALKRVSASKSGQGRNGLWTARYHIYYTDFSLETLEELLKKLDLDLDAGNVWDMVPYSFMVDWFYDLGTFFTACDNYFTLKKEYHCLGTVDSLKIQRHLEKGEVNAPAGVRFDLQWSYYRRHVGSIPAIPLSDETTHPTLTNMVEGAAIVVANLPV
jgi:hypothetical protein